MANASYPPCKVFFTEEYTFILIKCIEYRFMGRGCVCVCVCVYLLSWEVRGTFQGIPCKNKKFLRVLSLPLFFHSLGQLQSVLQTKKKKYEGAPFSSLFYQGNHTTTNMMYTYKYCTGLNLPFFA